MQKVIVIVSLCLLALSACAEPERADPVESTAFVIEGDLSKIYHAGEVVVWMPKRKAEEAGSAPSTSMGSTMGTRMGSTRHADDGRDVIGRKTLEKGRFTIKGDIAEPKQVYVSVENGRGPKGERWGTIKGLSFILEPGALEVAFGNRSDLRVEGGIYNDAVYNSWNSTDAYRTVEARMNEALDAANAEGVSEADKRTHMEAFGSCQSELFDLEARGREETATTHPDLTARILAMQTVWLGGRWMLKGYRGILELDPENAWAAEQLAGMEARYAKRDRQGEMVDIKDFDATDLDGRVFSLRDVCGRNKFVLLEFWASWCGPCRGELPHLLKAYDTYHGKGFEIFAFTIDDDRAAWKDASEEEQIPWINTGFSSESKPKAMYEVTGVPANFLIDGTTGKIVARNLRGHRLDEELAKRLR